MEVFYTSNETGVDKALKDYKVTRCLNEGSWGSARRRSRHPNPVFAPLSFFLRVVIAFFRVHLISEREEAQQGLGGGGSWRRPSTKARAAAPSCAAALTMRDIEECKAPSADDQVKKTSFCAKM